MLECSHGLLGVPLYTGQITYPGMTLPEVSCPLLLCQSVVLKVLYKLAYRQIIWSHFSVETFLSQRLQLLSADIRPAGHP